MLFDERTSSLAIVALAGLVAVLAVWTALLQRTVSTLRRRLRGLLKDETQGLDEVLHTALTGIDGLTSRVDGLNALQRELEQTGQRALQRVGVVRYNPFPDTGGDQSFAIALLDALGNGLVVSSLHSRAETRVFAKQVSGGRSKHQLSDEEQDAIRQALGTHA